MDNSIHSTWKSQSAAFPRPANRVTHNPKRAASSPHSYTADDQSLTAFCPLAGQPQTRQKGFYMAFFNSAVGVLQTLVVALGAELGIWGVINLMEGYGNDNPGANAHVR